MRNELLAAAVGALLSVPGMCLAHPFGAPPECASDLLFENRLGELGLARVTASGKLHFQQDTSGCPGPASCALKPYVVKGDLVVTGLRRGPWICVLYPNNVDNEGWVPLSAVSPVQVAAPKGSASWAGGWARDPKAKISIRAVGVLLKIDGFAFWTGQGPGNVNDGEIKGQAKPRGGYLTVADDFDDGCKPTFRLIGPYMAVTDDNKCGGLNVTFTGVYRRK
jgi:hypothetical protein